MTLDNRKLIALLVALSAFGPMSMSIYTPAMTTIGHALMATDEEVKLTLTTFLIGFSAGQILYGPLSDKYGRKPVLLVGAAVYTLMGLACAFAPTVQELIVLRIFHGLGVCSGAVMSRAIVRDTFGHHGSARVMSWISLGINIAPAIAPIMGGYLTAWFGWQSIFFVLALFGAIVFVVVLFGLRESNPYLGQSAGIWGTVKQAGPMLVHRQFLGYALAIGFTFAAMFAYVVGSPFVLMNKLGLSSSAFAYWILTSVAGFTVGSYIATRTVNRLPLPVCIIIGLAIAAAGGVLMLVLSLAGHLSALSIVGPYFFVAIGSGLTMAPAMAGSVNQFPRQAGTASSLMGTLQMGGAAISTAIVTALTDGTQMPMIWTMLGASILGLATTLLLLRPHRREPMIAPAVETVPPASAAT
jgi:DHA1 family bicyclomycin/chloramphenicol resistance-like MFS transporter